MEQKEKRRFRILAVSTMILLTVLQRQQLVAQMPESAPASQPNTAAENMHRSDVPAEWIPSFRAADAWREREIDRLTEEITRKTKDLKEGKVSSLPPSFRPGETAAQRQKRMDQSATPHLKLMGQRLQRIDDAPSMEDKLAARKELAELRKRQQALKAGEMDSLPPLGQVNLDVGQVGPLLAGQVKVVQILDEKNFRGQYLTEGYGSESDPGSAPRIEGGLLTHAPPMKRKWAAAVFFSGIYTDGLADGKTMNRPEWFLVTGNQSYTSNKGTRRTEFVLTVIDAGRWQVAYQKWQKQQEVFDKP